MAEKEPGLAAPPGSRIWLADMTASSPADGLHPGGDGWQVLSDAVRRLDLTSDSGMDLGAGSHDQSRVQAQADANTGGSHAGGSSSGENGYFRHNGREGDGIAYDRQPSLGQDVGGGAIDPATATGERRLRLAGAAPYIIGRLQLVDMRA